MSRLIFPLTQLLKWSSGIIKSALYNPHIRLGLKNLVNRFPHLNSLVRKMFISIDQRFHRSEISIISNFSPFAPYSAGPHKTIANLTVQAANQTFPLLIHLIEAMSNRTFEEPIPIHTFSDTKQAIDAASYLKVLLDKQGSDKATADRDYHHLYGSVLVNLGQAIDILEIGLGTNYPDIASNMGVSGKPGASLRAFKEFLPQARIYGADIDKRILFEESRIKTFYVDQTKLESFRGISNKVKHKFDLIIDDGLHSPNANLATLIFACNNLRQGGWVIIEDISPAAVPIWRVVSELLPTQYRSFLISANGAFVFAVNKSK